MTLRVCGVPFEHGSHGLLTSDRSTGAIRPARAGTARRQAWGDERSECLVIYEAIIAPRIRGFWAYGGVPGWGLSLQVRWPEPVRVPFSLSGARRGLGPRPAVRPLWAFPTATRDEPGPVPRSSFCDPVLTGRSCASSSLVRPYAHHHPGFRWREEFVCDFFQEAQGPERLAHEEGGRRGPAKKGSSCSGGTSERRSGPQGLTQRALVEIVELAPDRHPVREAGDLHPGAGQPVGDVMGG